MNVYRSKRVEVRLRELYKRAYTCKLNKWWAPLRMTLCAIDRELLRKDLRDRYPEIYAE